MGLIVIAMRVQFALFGMRSSMVEPDHAPPCTNANEEQKLLTRVLHTQLSLELCIEPHNRLADLILFSMRKETVLQACSTVP